MLHQPEEERQVFRADPLFVERENELPGRGGQQEIAVLDAFGDAFDGGERADVVARQKLRLILVIEIGVDRLGRVKPRGSAGRAAA
jgi:hypothetical protein